MSDSPGLVDFAIGLVNSVVNLPDGQVKFFEEFKLQKNCEINLLIKTLLGPVEMMFGLVNANFSLPEWQAVKMTFFAPCLQTSILLPRFPFPQLFLSSKVVLMLRQRMHHIVFFKHVIFYLLISITFEWLPISVFHLIVTKKNKNNVKKVGKTFLSLIWSSGNSQISKSYTLC